MYKLICIKQKTPSFMNIYESTTLLPWAKTKYFQLFFYPEKTSPQDQSIAPQANAWFACSLGQP